MPTSFQPTIQKHLSCIDFVRFIELDQESKYIAILLEVNHRVLICQRIFSDSKLQDMKNRLFHKRNSLRFLQLRQHWHSRMGMVEWMRDMYDEYRLRKWTEIQDLINNIFATYSSEEVMTVLILAEVSSQSIGIFIENEEEGETSVNSESDVSQVEEVMMVEGDSEEGQGTRVSGEMGEVNTVVEDEEMEDVSTFSVATAL